MAKASPLGRNKSSRVRPGSERRRLQPSLPVQAATDIPADPDKPTRGVSPKAIALAAAAVPVFLFGIVFFLTSNLASDLNLLGVSGFAVIFFTLTLGLARRAARDPRWGGPDHGTLAEFARDNVSVATGTISGREALVEILVLPATLATGMLVIALIFAMGL